MSYFEKPEEHYEKNAKPGCRQCGGRGVETYHIDQDWTERAPCLSCFQEDKGALAAEKWWNSRGRDHFRPREVHHRSSR